MPYIVIVGLRKQIDGRLWPPHRDRIPHAVICLSGSQIACQTVEQGTIPYICRRYVTMSTPSKAVERHVPPSMLFCKWVCSCLRDMHPRNVRKLDSLTSFGFFKFSFSVLVGFIFSHNSSRVSSAHEFAKIMER